VCAVKIVISMCYTVLYPHIKCQFLTFSVIQTVTSRSHKQEATHLFPTLQMQRSNEIKVVRNRSTQFHVTTLAQQSFHVTVYDLQFKTTAFFDETIVSGSMKYISCNWFSLCMTQQIASSFRNLPHSTRFTPES
jgi:hypothetical protein